MNDTFYGIVQSEMGIVILREGMPWLVLWDGNM
jgi:hypothetical protein